MLNLTSKKTLDAKMRVKSDIFAGWEEEVDHQVRVCVSADTARGGGGCRYMHTFSCLPQIVCVFVLQVRVMYTPFIGDEKRDIVEYTSLGPSLLSLCLSMDVCQYDVV